MAQRQLPVEHIARRLGRSEGAIRAEAARRRLPLAATDKRPYGVSGGRRPTGGASPRPRVVVAEAAGTRDAVGTRGYVARAADTEIATQAAGARTAAAQGAEPPATLF